MNSLMMFSFGAIVAIFALGVTVATAIVCFAIGTVLMDREARDDE